MRYLALILIFCTGMYLAARDYGGVTLWDMRMNRYLTKYEVLPSARDKLMSHLYDRYVLLHTPQLV